MEVYLLVTEGIAFLPLGSILGRASSSPKIEASSSRLRSTSSSLLPAEFPAHPNWKMSESPTTSGRMARRAETSASGSDPNDVIVQSWP